MATADSAGANADANSQRSPSQMLNQTLTKDLFQSQLQSSPSKAKLLQELDPYIGIKLDDNSIFGPLAATSS